MCERGWMSVCLREREQTTEFRGHRGLRRCVVGRCGGGGFVGGVLVCARGMMEWSSRAVVVVVA